MPTIPIVNNPWGMPAGQGPNPAPWNAHPPAQPRSPGVPLLIVAAVAVIGMGTVLALVLSRAFRSNGATENANIMVRAQTPNTNNTNRSTPMVTPTPMNESAPVPAPARFAVDPSTARAGAMSVMNSWVDSLRRRNIEDNLILYANHLGTFYTESNVDIGRVRYNRELTFRKFYDSTDVQLSNVSINVAGDGMGATVSYDNTYDWRGGTRFLNGKSHNEIDVELINGRWLIVNERHITTYYENKGN